MGGGKIDTLTSEIEELKKRIEVLEKNIQGGTNKDSYFCVNTGGSLCMQCDMGNGTLRRLQFEGGGLGIYEHTNEKDWTRIGSVPINFTTSL